MSVTGFLAENRVTGPFYGQMEIYMKVFLFLLLLSFERLSDLFSFSSFLSLLLGMWHEDKRHGRGTEINTKGNNTFILMCYMNINIILFHFHIHFFIHNPPCQTNQN